MAGLTFRTQSLLVDILFLVTSDAGRGRVLKGERLVAFPAGSEVMGAAQGECGRLMIEHDRSPPFFRMAGFAFGALLSFMFVIFLVTGVAVGLHFVLVEMAGMATLAGDDEMSPTQWKFCETIVIE